MRTFINLIRSLFVRKPKGPTQPVNNEQAQSVVEFQSLLDAAVKLYQLDPDSTEIRALMIQSEAIVAEDFKVGRSQSGPGLLGHFGPNAGNRYHLLRALNPDRCVVSRNGGAVAIEKGSSPLAAVSLIEHFRHHLRLGIEQIETGPADIKFIEDGRVWITYRLSAADGDLAVASRKIIQHFTNGLPYEQIMNVYAKDKDRTWKQVTSASLAH